MRAGPLSTQRVIDLLNHYFVPIYVSTDDYDKDGGASAEEKAEFTRLFGEAGDPKKGIGFLLAPDARVVDTFISSPAMTPEKVAAVLEAVVQKLKTPPGETLAKPEPQVVVPRGGAGVLTLHLTARYLPPGEGWARMPAEDFILLAPAEWAKLLPPGKADVGTAWDVDAKVASKMLIHFYPPSLNFYYSHNRIDRQELRATVVSAKDGVARVRLDGSLKMKHSFVPDRDDDLFAEAGIVGFVDCDLERKQLRGLAIVTDKATYAKGNFAVAVRLVP